MKLNDVGAIASEWQQRTVKIKNTTFHFDEMLCMEAFDVLEQIRETTIGSVLSMPPELSQQQMMAFMITKILAIKRSDLRMIMNDMFNHVYFTNDIHPSKEKVLGNENAAFSGLQPTVVYEVLARSVCVNFSESLSDLMRRVGAET